jgi:hypothetical protein
MVFPAVNLENPKIRVRLKKIIRNKMPLIRESGGMSIPAAMMIKKPDKL